MAQPATHPLNNSWDIWYTPNITAEMSKEYGSWEAANKATTAKIDTITTVEAFWAVMSALPPASKLPKDENVMFFRDGIAPKWEDAAFKAKPCGRWMIKLDVDRHADKLIQNLLVNVLGEQLSVDTNTTGLVGGLRYVKKDNKRDVHIRVEMWITDAEHNETIKAKVLALANELNLVNVSKEDNLSFKPF